ncbi:CRP-like cAMP-binding protein [Sphingomonas zeicaulis]|uniref:Crp/Fnr family transcriptional regulator n=1 Tax=Sphingomonas zeicaulis TaxID=1632740 RepID=UPI003D1E0217
MNVPKHLPALNLWLERLLMRSPLTEEEQSAIRGLPCEIAEVGAHRDFIRLGETRNHVCLIAEGLVGRFAQTLDGGRQIFALHIPGDVADIYSLLVPNVGAGLQALSHAMIVIIPHRALWALIARYPRVGYALWRDCIVDASILSTWVLNLGCRTGGARLAHLLCELAVRYALIGQARGMRYDMLATQHHLAECTGMTSVHLNRMMMDLRSRELVRTQSRGVEILDWEGLVDAAGFDPHYLHLSPAAAERAQRALRVI